ncbi:MAG TPA: DUF892 family protein [Chryseolinea sp.]|nr:DUF892 family protein [Chryseolinea sp.]
MKKIIHNLQDALAFQLQGLLSIEKEIDHVLKTCSQYTGSPKIKKAIHEYVASASDKVLKIDRVFNYLMEEPIYRKNEIFNKMVDETHQLLSCTASVHLKDIMLITCIQTINAKKIASYKTAYIFAAELEMDTASELLQQILEWELETEKVLASLAVEEFNKIQLVAS